jgi:two-component system response regulator RegA
LQSHKHPESPPIANPRRLLRVLIVEDEPRLRDLLSEVIPEMGFTATAVRAAEDALRHMGTEPVEIAILDLNLPLMNGMDLFRIIHDRWPAIAVIILTGFGDLAAAREAIRLDVIDFLSKPFHLRDIEESLARASDRVLGKRDPDDRAQTTESTGPMTLEENERRLIVAALERHHGNRTAAAAELGISRRKLHYWLSADSENRSS